MRVALVLLLSFALCQAALPEPSPPFPQSEIRVDTTVDAVGAS